MSYLQEKYRSRDLQAPDNYQQLIDGFKTESEALQQKLGSLRTMTRELVDGVSREENYSQLDLAQKGKAIDEGFDEIEEQEFESSALRLIVSHLCWRRKMLVALPLQKILFYYEEYLGDSQFVLETLWAPIFDPFDHLWAIGAPLDPSWEGSEKATVFLSLWDPPRTS